MNCVHTVLVLFLILPLPAGAQEIGTLTLVEGPLRVIRGTTVLQGAEGVRVFPGDMIESSDSGFVQVEFAGGTIIVLGGSTRVLLFSHDRGRSLGNPGNSAGLFLLSGWLKGQSGARAGAHSYDSPLLAASTQDGTLVLHSAGASVEMFVEYGSARVSEVSPDGIRRDPRVTKAGQFSSRLAGKDITVYPRPSSTFVEAMPRQFRDSFPSRMSRFAEKPPQPKRDHEVTYFEIQPWLTIGQTWRKGFVKRFQSRLKDPKFHKAVESHLKDHPEWGPLIFPEAYPPKTASTAAGNPVPKKN